MSQAVRGEASLKLRLDMTGERFGRLVGTAFSHRDAGGHANWRFACDCGGKVVAKGTNVRRGNTTSCGCLHREISAARLTTHGFRAGRRHGPTYRAWQMMNDGCCNRRSPKYPACGGQGIRVCPEWRSDFEVFPRDLGSRPPSSKLARLDGCADFTTANCFWAPLPANAPVRSSAAEAGLPPGTVRRSTPSNRDEHPHG